MNIGKHLTRALSLGVLTLGALALTTTAAPADESSPISIRAVGGAQLGGTWNVGLTGVGKLVNERYPGSTFNVLQGASTSNPLRLETNGGDLSITQSFNTYAALNGVAPYKKPLTNVLALANINDTGRMQIIARKDLPVDSFDELMEKKLPVHLDRGATGTLHNVLGALILAEYGYTYNDIEAWGGKVTAVSNNDLVGLMQDGTINVAFKQGPGEQSQIQEMVLNAKVKWLPVSDEVLARVAAKTGLNIGSVPATFYGGAVGRDIPCLVDTSVMIIRKGVSEEDAYKITKSLVEGCEELHAIQPTWKTLRPETMPTGLLLPLHPGAEKYYREAGLLK